jgi:hypothetical protein
MKDPENLVLKHVKFHRDLKTITYFFRLDSKDRSISYSFEEDDKVKIGVRETSEGVPFIELLAAHDNVRARTRDGEFVLDKGKRVLPATTDEPSIWLLAQDWINNSTTTPGRLLDMVIEQLPADSEVETSAFLGLGNLIALLKDLFGWLWPGGDDDCLNPDQWTTCTETNIQGEETEVKFTCDCGTPFCTNQAFTAEVPILVTDESTGEQHADSMIVTYTVCVCWCQVIEMGG